jgi:hypothetical protein
MSRISLSPTTPDLIRDFIRFVAPSVGAKSVHTPRVQLSGAVRDGAGPAKIIEYAVDGEIVARLVRACGSVECWLRADMATATLVARVEDVAETERMKARVLDDYHHASPQHARDQRAEEYVLSSSLIHAAARRQSTLGRLYDMNARGDKVRGNLVAALDRAVKAEGAK